MQSIPIQLKLEFLIPPQPSTGPTPSSLVPSCPAATADWNQLDEAARGAALGLLARLIARMLAQAPMKETDYE